MKMTILLLLIACSACTAKSEPNWTEIAGYIEAYAKRPSSDNAKRAVAILPDKEIRFSGTSEESQANQTIYSEKTMAVLEQQVLKRDRASVELAFRLMNIADGAFAEELGIIVAKLIKVDPRLFLTELKKAKRSDLEELVLNLDESYPDEMEKTCAEWHLRKKALQTVQVPGLELTRQNAIAVIDDAATSCTTPQNAPQTTPMPTAPRSQ